LKAAFLRLSGCASTSPGPPATGEKEKKVINFIIRVGAMLAVFLRLEGFAPTLPPSRASWEKEGGVRKDKKRTE